MVLNLIYFNYFTLRLVCYNLFSDIVFYFDKIVNKIILMNSIPELHNIYLNIHYKT